MQTATAKRRDVSHYTDTELVDLVRGGNGDAFRAIMQRYNQRLYRVARGIVRDEAEAEDVLQEAYMRGFAALREFRGDSGLATWLTRIVMNEAFGRMRRRRPTEALESLDRAIEQGDTRVIMFPGVHATPSPEVAAARAEVRRIFEHAIDELPETFRLVFLMHDVEELSIEETAAQLDIRPETVKTRLHRARKLLRQHLDAKLASVLKDPSRSRARAAPVSPTASWRGWVWPTGPAEGPPREWCRERHRSWLRGSGDNDGTCREGLHALPGRFAPLGPEEAARYLAEVPGWTLADEASAIKRTYRFGNFREALAFADRVGALAESEGHHPDICFGWGYAKVSLQTKKIKGLHETTSSWPRRSIGQRQPDRRTRAQGRRLRSARCPGLSAIGAISGEYQTRAAIAPWQRQPPPLRAPGTAIRRRASSRA